jgi:DNA-binding MarR family transcriptional regulator
MHSNELDELVRDIYGLAAANRELQRRAVPEHPPACLQALSVIARTDARRVSEVADRMRIDLSVASRQVAVLEAEGWVRRERDPHDGRAQRLEATEAGLAALADVRARMAGAYENVLAGWSEHELQALHATLARLREDFTRVAQPATAAAA